MKKLMLAAAAVMVSGLYAAADITVNLPKGSQTKELMMQRGYLNRALNAKPGEKTSEELTVKVMDGKAVVNTLPDSVAQYVIPFGDRQYIMLYSYPGDNLTVDVMSESPLDYTVKGNALMDAISGMNAKAGKFLDAYRTEEMKPDANADTLQKYADSYDAVFTDFVNANPDSPAVAYAMTQMDGEKFLEYYNKLSPAARKSPLMPIVERQKTYVDRQVEMERRKAILTTGNVDAPNFTFEDRNGKQVSLSDFKGKWVIIDFWGSWCRWCIKGFPSLKACYEKNKPQVEVIGVACRDSKEAWLKALDKYELPWVNVWNPEQNGGQILQEYAVEGFPCKVIVDPQGKIRNITTGDDPAFYTVLEGLLSGKDTKK